MIDDDICSIVVKGLSRTISEINGDFSRKSPNFPTPVYLTPPLKGFPLELGIGARGQKSSNDEATRWLKKINVGFVTHTTGYDRRTDEQTDRQTRCRSKDRAMLCVALVIYRTNAVLT